MAGIFLYLSVGFLVAYCCSDMVRLFVASFGGTWKLSFISQALIVLFYPLFFIASLFADRSAR